MPGRYCDGTSVTGLGSVILNGPGACFFKNLISSPVILSLVRSSIDDHGALRHELFAVRDVLAAQRRDSAS